MNNQGGGQAFFSALSESSQALLKRARGAVPDAQALALLRDELSELSDQQIADVWRALDAGSVDDADDGDLIYRAVDKARRKLGLAAARFRDLLIEKFEAAGDPAPAATSGSLRALVDAFIEASREDELVATVDEIVRTRSMAFDIT